MRIRHSAEADLWRIMEIYSFARKYMAEHGNPNQWGPANWPPETLIRSDIRNGNSYVCLNDEGNVIGTFFFIHGQDIEFCINWAFEQCGHLRIDTHGDNIVMQNLVKKLGFVHCGTIYVEEDNNPRLAFEKTAAGRKGV